MIDLLCGIGKIKRNGRERENGKLVIGEAPRKCDALARRGIARQHAGLRNAPEIEIAVTIGGIIDGAITAPIRKERALATGCDLQFARHNECAAGLIGNLHQAQMSAGLLRGGFCALHHQHVTPRRPTREAVVSHERHLPRRFRGARIRRHDENLPAGMTGHRRHHCQVIAIRRPGGVAAGNIAQRMAGFGFDMIKPKLFSATGATTKGNGAAIRRKDGRHLAHEVGRQARDFARQQAIMLLFYFQQKEITLGVVAPRDKDDELAVR